MKKSASIFLTIKSETVCFQSEQIKLICFPQRVGLIIRFFVLVKYTSPAALEKAIVTFCLHLFFSFDEMINLLTDFTMSRKLEIFSSLNQMQYLRGAFLSSPAFGATMQSTTKIPNFILKIFYNGVLNVGTDEFETEHLIGNKENFELPNVRWKIETFSHYSIFFMHDFKSED